MRKCVACGENKPKKELIRVVRSTEGIVEIDLTGKKNGRGAYICSSTECVKMAKKNKNLVKALKAEVLDEVYEKLFELIDSNNVSE
ncbi:MAG: YlxR family protein [Tissierellia bacterium]|nr:YlxR family protein [Tissierellia bacterium]